MSKASERDMAIQQELDCPGCGAKYAKKRHLCFVCGQILDQDLGVQRLIGRTATCVIDRIRAEEQERCAKLCEGLAKKDASMERVGAYLNAANEIRGEE